MSFQKRNFCISAAARLLYEKSKDPSLLDKKIVETIATNLIKSGMAENKEKYTTANSKFERVKNHGLIIPQINILGENKNVISFTTAPIVRISDFTFRTFACNMVWLQSHPNQMFFPSEMGNENIYYENSKIIRQLGLDDHDKMQNIAKQLDLYCQYRATLALMNRGKFKYVSQNSTESKMKTFDGSNSNFYWGEIAKRNYISDPMLRSYFISSKTLEISCTMLRHNLYLDIMKLQTENRVKLKFDKGIDDIDNRDLDDDKTNF